jgi:hypothetical protein
MPFLKNLLQNLELGNATFSEESNKFREVVFTD